jgi:hypothetical protein
MTVDTEITALHFVRWSKSAKTLFGPAKKIIIFASHPNHTYNPPVPSRLRGVSRSSRMLGMRWTWQRRKTSGAHRSIAHWIRSTTPSPADWHGSSAARRGSATCGSACKASRRHFLKTPRWRGRGAETVGRRDDIRCSSTARSRSPSDNRGMPEPRSAQERNGSRWSWARHCPIASRPICPGRG